MHNKKEYCSFASLQSQHSKELIFHRLIVGKTTKERPRDCSKF